MNELICDVKEMTRIWF